MAYRIGQVRKNNSSSYLVDLGWRADSVKTAGYANKVFDDYAIVLNSGTFNANNTYYLRVSIKRIDFLDQRFIDIDNTTMDDNDPRRMNVKIQLLKNDGSEANPPGTYVLGTYQTIKGAFKVDPYIEGVNSPYASFETIFTPNDNYTYLAFILSRVPYDYTVSARQDLDTSIDLGARGDICTINNILPITAANKIGVQSRPGSLICVNKEPIRIGKSGTYEVNNGVPISYVGFASPNGSNANNIDKFILDYAWDE